MAIDVGTGFGIAVAGLSIACSLLASAFYVGKKVGNLSSDVREIRKSTVKISILREKVGDELVRQGISTLLDRISHRTNPLTEEEQEKLITLLTKAKSYEINQDDADALESLLKKELSEEKEDNIDKFIISAGIGAFVGYILARSLAK